MTSEYEKIFRGLRSHLCIENPASTPKTTASIKEYFRKTYAPEYNVLFSGPGSYECLIDILVSTVNPKKVLSEGVMQISDGAIKAFIGVESELGGSGGGSQRELMKNVVEDFTKLLLVGAKYRVMIFTSLPYAKEEEHVKKRVEMLRDVYIQSCRDIEGVLAIHIFGSRLGVNQVQVSVNTENLIRGFFINTSGEISEYAV